MNEPAQHKTGIPTPRDKVKFPLYLQFEVRHPLRAPFAQRAGFRNWNHYLRYVAEMLKVNHCEIRQPIIIDEATGLPKATH